MARTPPPNIDPAPTPPPQRGDKSSFSQRVDAFVLWITAAVSQFLALALNVYNNALDAFASANSAAGSAGAAANSAYYAADSATAAAQQVPLAQQKVVDAAAQVALATQQAQAASGSATAAAGSATASELSRLQVDKRYLGAKASGPTTDNQGAALQTGAVYYDTTAKAIMTWNGAAWVQGVTSGAGVSTIDGEAGALTLKTIGGVSLLGAGDIAPNQVQRSARTANTKLVADDKSKWLALSGTFTQTFDTAANLGQGWFIYISNKGTGNITIPSSDGVTNWIMYPNETRLFVCDGSGIASVVLSAYKLTSQVSGTWIKPPGYNYHRARPTGSGAGGGGGGGGSTGSALANGSANNGGGGGGGGTGGAAGATVEAVIPDSVLPVSAPFTVGAAGTGGNGGAGAAALASGGGPGLSGTSGNAGTAGNQSVFGTPGSIWYVAAPGGATGGAAGGGGAGGGGGTASNNSTAAAFSATNTGAYTLPTTAPGAANAGSSSAASTSASSVGGAGGAGGNGGISSQLVTAPTGGAGGASNPGVGTAGNAGAAAVAPSAAGAGGAGGGGGSGSTGSGTTTNAATGKGGDGGRGADGAAGQFEISGVI